MARYSLGVIARRHGDNPRSAFAGRKQRQPIGRAPFLEGPGGLKIIQLKENPCPRGTGNGLAFERWGTEHSAGDTPGGGANIGQGNGAAFGLRRAHRHVVCLN